MTDEFASEAARVLDEHGAFAERGDGFVVTTTPFDARVRVDGDAYRVTVRVPTIDAAVEGETVAAVVRENWFETLERRVADVSGVVRADPEGPTVGLDGEDVVIEARIEGAADRAAADAKAFVDFVEGTYLQGVIPGYDYREPVAGLLARAGERSEGDGLPPL